MKTLIYIKRDHFTSLSMTSPMQGAVAMTYPILDFAGQAVRPGKLKDDSKNVNGQNKCKLPVSISLVNFHGKFALKFEMKEFYESLLDSFGANGQA